MVQYFLVALVFGLVGAQDCYWNRECPYKLFSSKTPYDAVRGDIRDYPLIDGCEAISVWTLNRHGNRNPGSSVTAAAKIISELKDDIIDSFYAGTSQLCAQDIDLFRRYTWNETIEVAPSFLTGTGYEELYDIATRLREKYPHLLENPGEMYFRPTNEQRTVTSAIAFAHGLSDGTNLNVTIDDFLEADGVIRPYDFCERYQQDVRASTLVEDHLDVFWQSPPVVEVINNVQQRLGISYQLTPDDVYTIYELCRYDRSWNPELQSPWCSAFSNDDLVVLEYRDDLRHYYRNGYGYWTNIMLGEPALHDLYTNFEASVSGQGRTITAYFTHDTLMEMVAAAMGIFKDDYQLTGDVVLPDRKWRTSVIGAFSTNLLAILNRCDDNTHRVQLFYNELETEICPLSGCTWEEFQQKFQNYSPSLEFCSLDYVYVPPEVVPEVNPDASAEVLEEAEASANVAVCAYCGLTRTVLLAFMILISVMNLV